MARKDVELLMVLVCVPDLFRAWISSNLGCFPNLYMLVNLVEDFAFLAEL